MGGDHADVSPSGHGPSASPPRVYGTPGASAREEHRRRRRADRARRRPLAVVLFAVVAAGLAFAAVQFASIVLDRAVARAITRAAPARTAPSAPPLPVGMRTALGLVVAAVAGAGTLAAGLGRRQSTEAWARGAAGEEAVGARLDRLAARGSVVVLHDRAMPRSRANIDHLVVARSGVYVVDTKRWSGRFEIRGARRGTGQRGTGQRGTGQRGTARLGAGGRLVVAGRDRTAAVDSVHNQAGVVTGVLADAGLGPGAVAVQPFLVFAGNGPAWWVSPRRVHGVAVCGVGALVRAARRRGPIPDELVRALGALLADRLPDRCVASVPTDPHDSPRPSGSVQANPRSWSP